MVHVLAMIHQDVAIRPCRNIALQGHLPLPGNVLCHLSLVHVLSGSSAGFGGASYSASTPHDVSAWLIEG